MTKDAKCTEEEFNSLHKALEESRKSSEFVRVPRQALVNLLMDHAHLWDLTGAVDRT